MMVVAEWSCVGSPIGGVFTRLFQSVLVLWHVKMTLQKFFIVFTAPPSSKLVYSAAYLIVSLTHVIGISDIT